MPAQQSRRRSRDRQPSAMNRLPAQEQLLTSPGTWRIISIHVGASSPDNVLITHTGTFAVISFASFSGCTVGGKTIDALGDEGDGWCLATLSGNVIVTDAWTDAGNAAMNDDDGRPRAASTGTIGAIKIDV